MKNALLVGLVTILGAGIGHPTESELAARNVSTEHGECKPKPGECCKTGDFSCEFDRKQGQALGIFTTELSGTLSPFPGFETGWEAFTTVCNAQATKKKCEKKNGCYWTGCDCYKSYCGVFTKEAHCSSTSECEWVPYDERCATWEYNVALHTIREFGLEPVPEEVEPLQSMLGDVIGTGDTEQDDGYTEISGGTCIPTVGGFDDVILITPNDPDPQLNQWFVLGDPKGVSGVTQCATKVKDNPECGKIFYVYNEENDYTHNINKNCGTDPTYKYCGAGRNCKCIPKGAQCDKNTSVFNYSTYAFDSCNLVETYANGKASVRCAQQVLG